MQQYSVDVQRELPYGMSVSVGYTGLTGSNLGWGGSGNALVNINQLDPKYQSLGGNATLELVPNPFFGVPEAGQFATRAQAAAFERLMRLRSLGSVERLSPSRRSNTARGLASIGSGVVGPRQEMVLV